MDEINRKSEIFESRLSVLSASTSSGVYSNNLLLPSDLDSSAGISGSEDENTDDSRIRLQKYQSLRVKTRDGKELVGLDAATALKMESQRDRPQEKAILVWIASCLSSNKTVEEVCLYILFTLVKYYSILWFFF